MEIKQKKTNLIKAIEAESLLGVGLIPDPNEVQEILSIDGLAIQEELTGISYKKISPLESLKMFASVNALKKKALDATGDNKYGDSYSNVVKLIESLGFKEYWSETFEDNSWKEISTNTYKIFIHEEYSILLDIEGYFNDSSVSMVQMWYNWSANKGSGLHPNGASGGIVWKDDNPVYVDDNLEAVKIKFHPKVKWNLDSKESHENFKKREELSPRYKQDQKLQAKYRYVASCHHDVREGLKNTMQILLRDGRFVQKWIEPYSCISLNNYKQDYKFLKDGNAYAYKLVNVPAHIRKNLGI